MNARHTLVLSIIAGSVGAAAIQSFRGQAKPKIHRVVTIIVAALGAMLSAARAETPIERGGYLVNAVMACDGATRRGCRAAHSTCQRGFPVGRRPEPCRTDSRRGKTSPACRPCDLRLAPVHGSRRSYELCNEPC
jgi:hypothetical protein